MKRFLSLMLCILFAVCLFSCKKEEPAVTTLTQEEIDAILAELELGETLPLDDYTEEQQQQIEDALGEGGFLIDENQIVVPQSPLDDETIKDIVEDAAVSGSVDTSDFDEAQKEQIEDALEEEGMTPVVPEEKEDEIVVDPLPALTEEELVAVLKSWDLDETQPPLEYSRQVDLSEFNLVQRRQLEVKIGTLGLEFVEVDGNLFLRTVEFIFEEVADNPYE